MNHDYIVIFSIMIGTLPGFLVGYVKGHADGLAQARRSYYRLTRQQQKANR